MSASDKDTQFQREIQEQRVEPSNRGKFVNDKLENRRETEKKKYTSPKEKQQLTKQINWMLIKRKIKPLKSDECVYVWVRVNKADGNQRKVKWL